MNYPWLLPTDWAAPGGDLRGRVLNPVNSEEQRDFFLIIASYCVRFSSDDLQDLQINLKMTFIGDHSTEGHAEHTQHLSQITQDQKLNVWIFFDILFIGYTLRWIQGKRYLGVITT